MMSEFEKQVRHALIDRDMTMTDLANELGITISYVSDLLKGKRTNQEQLQRIKEFLEITDTDDYEECCNGRFLGIEVKAKNGKPSPLQIHNLKKIDEAGGYGILLYPDHFELFKNFIDCLKVNDANTAYNYDLLKRRWLDG